ncbi:peptidoglycan DD-metalloendopeptidase family protein [bacterium]|nr:peptidoglycan DD-metalloendopeptidase family protein [bacterium]
MKRIWDFLPVGCIAFALMCAACDLQPKIVSIPDSVGDFISDRYPALLADPETQPEIYNSAASDYGMYASPELYGSVETDDYILYSDINDYMFPAQPASAAASAYDDKADADAVIVAEYQAPAIAKSDETVPVTTAANEMSDDVLVVPMYGGAADVHTVTVARGETLYTIARRYGTTVQEISSMNPDLKEPYALRVGQKLRVPGNGDIVVAADKISVPEKKTETAPPAPKADAPAVAVAATPSKTPTPARVELQQVTVGPGDTLYSISRAYSVPVNDLAVMNDLAAPFKLTVGQKLKVPNLAGAARTAAATTAKTTTPVPAAQPKVATPSKPTTTEKTPAKKETKKQETKKPKATQTQKKEKISSDPKKKLPAIAARSSSKFSWPVRGKILSSFGSKPNGLVNDGINIAASRGTNVRAAENGVVAYAGNEVKGMGNLIILQHSDGWMTVYAHLDSMAVRRGAKVSVGQKIGTVGASGKVDQPQLHFEIRKGTKAYNPAQYLKK